MFLILLCTFHFSFCAWEWVTTWKASIRVTSINFGTKEGGYWDPGSDKAEPYVRVFCMGLLFSGTRAGQDLNPGSWYSPQGTSYGERTGTEAQLRTVTFELYDYDADGDDLMGASSFDITNYKSNGGTFTFVVSFGRHRVEFTAGLWPYTTTACTSRVPSTKATGCYSPSDSYVGQTACAQPLNPSGSKTYLNSCVFSSNCGTNLTDNNGANGLCNLSPCSLNDPLRFSNRTFTYPCGENTCHQQLDANGLVIELCMKGCFLGYFFHGNNNTGKCEFKECASRLVSSTANYPCGTPDCYQQISNGGSGSGTLNESCDSSCDPNHFKTSSGFKCVLLDCDQRKAVPSLRYPCGTTDCYQQPDRITCGLTCIDHYNETDDGRCSSLPCGIRDPVNGTCRLSDGHPEDEPYCGFYNEENSTLPFSGCVLCPDDHFRSVDGVCELKTCSERLKNTTAKFLCGEEECYVQPKISTNECEDESCSEIYDPNENVTDSGKCAKACPEFYASKQGICTIVPCLERIPTNKTCRPDAAFAENEPKCGYYSEWGTDQGRCVHCDENQYWGVNGVCVFKDCAARVPNPTAEFPCGEPSCFLYPDNTSTCVTKCPEFFENPATPGICNLLPCLERIPTDRNCRPDAAFAENETNCGFYSENGTDQGECVYCLENHFMNANGVCVLKDCAARTFSATTNIPCGELTCLLQPSESDCDRHCPLNVSTPDIHSGMCKYLMCGQRYKDDIYGCGPDCFLGEDGLKCVAEDPAAKAKSKKVPFPWWIIAVVVPVVVVSIAVVIIVLVIRMRTHKETQKDEPPQQQQGTEMAANNGEETANDQVVMGKPVVLLEEQEGSVKAFQGEDGGGDTGHWI